MVIFAAFFGAQVGRPGAHITRAEVATVFFRLLKPEYRNAYLTSESNFGDVDSTAWYSTAVATLEAMGILRGYEDGLFYPENPITCAEYATIVARFIRGEGKIETSFTDIAGHWAEKDIQKAASFGWVVGFNGPYRPDDSITRAEAITLTNRVLKRVPETVSDLLPSMRTWSDNSNTEMWYYIPVQEATNSHGFEYKASGFAYWTQIEPDPDWQSYQ